MSKTYIDLEFFREAGRKGGRKTRDKTTPEWRKANAIKAVTARWKRYREGQEKGDKK